MTAPLPHNDVFNDLPAEAAVQQLRASPQKDVHLAVSKGFWDDEASEDIYAAYQAFFDRKKAELIKVLGPPVFDGHWVSDDYPVWAIGESIATWGTAEDAIYLRIHHEDKELPIEVSLLTRASPSSNHEPESAYEGLREIARQHRGE